MVAFADDKIYKKHLIQVVRDAESNPGPVAYFKGGGVNAPNDLNNNWFYLVVIGTMYLVHTI